jgi:hypothetical protein
MYSFFYPFLVEVRILPFQGHLVEVRSTQLVIYCIRYSYFCIMYTIDMN